MTVEKKTANHTKGKRATAKKSVKEHAGRAGEAVVTIDRRVNRERRKPDEHRQRHESGDIEHRQIERRVKVNRRRQIDPTTCERDYSAEEVEFMGAMDAYKRRSGRMFPTCSEVLEVIRSLGYVKQQVAETPVVPTAPIMSPASLPVGMLHTPMSIG